MGDNCNYIISFNFIMWLTGWDKRIKVTADHTVVDGDLSHFPLTFKLGTSVGKTSADVSCVFDELTSNDNRKKIAITKTDGETQLYVEIEQWDDANEKAVLHAGITGDTLSSSADTDYYLYYDNSHADNTTYVGDVGGRTEVWDSNFKAVYHLADDDTDQTVLDSTTDYNATKLANAEPANTSSGKIDSAQHFDGSNDYIGYAGSLIGTLSTDFTVECWVKLDTVAAREYILGFGNDSETNSLVGIDYNDAGYLEWVIRDSSNVNAIFTGTGSITDSTWYHLVLVWNAATNTTYGYLNGASDGSQNNDSVGTGTFTLNSIGILRRTSIQFPTDGIIDEVRISSSLRNAAYAKASYYSGSDNLVSWGSEETAPVTFVPQMIFI